MMSIKDTNIHCSSSKDTNIHCSSSKDTNIHHYGADEHGHAASDSQSEVGFSHFWAHALARGHGNRRTSILAVEFGDAGDKSCIEKKFEGLAHRSFEVYKGLRFYNGEQALTVKRWLHRIDADSSGLTFEAWDPSQDDLDPNVQPAFMIVNSSEARGVATLDRGASAEFQKIPPPALQGVAPTGKQTRSAGVRALNPALGPCTYALRVDVDNTWRERCE